MRLPPSLENDRSWMVHLTCAAPGCAGATVGSERRNRMLADTPLRVLRGLLVRLRLAPEQARVILNEMGDPELRRVVDDCPLALFWRGATADELAQVLRFLVIDGWAPRDIAPLPTPVTSPQPELAA